MSAYSKLAKGEFSYGRVGKMITPSDTTDLEEVSRVLVCSVGMIVFVPEENADDEPITIEATGSPMFIPYLVGRVLATGTGASCFR